MQVDYEALKKSIDDLDLNRISTIQYNGREYWINPTSAPGHGASVEMFPSTAHSGADVYAWETLETELKKPLILHEIVEWDLKQSNHTKWNEAHKVARAFEVRYVRETAGEIGLHLHIIKRCHLDIADMFTDDTYTHAA
jgi:hypothetical protein